MDALSIYSRDITDEEWRKLAPIQPLGDYPMIHPHLLQFAAAAGNPQAMEAGLKAFAERIFSCSCWHCLEMRKRDEITSYDVWLRTLLWCNGIIQYQLN